MKKLISVLAVLCLLCTAVAALAEEERILHDFCVITPQMI